MGSRRGPIEMIAAPAEVRKILEDETWSVTDATANFNAVSDRCGERLSLSARVVSFMPLAWEGAAHSRYRRASAMEIALPAEDDLTAGYKSILIDQADRQAKDGESGDLLATLAGPLTDHTLLSASRHLASGCDQLRTNLSNALNEEGGLDRFFDPSASVGRRLKNEAVLRRMMELLISAGFNENNAIDACRIFVMGRDPLRSVFAGLLRQFDVGRSVLDEIPLGVRWAMRVRPDDRRPVRLDLTGAPNLVFGAGRHRCTGKALAVRAAAAFRQAMTDTGFEVVIHRFEPCRENAVLATPVVLEGCLRRKGNG